MNNKNNENHIFPFLWMRGEEEAVMRREMEKIAECGIGAVCVEARPHKDYCGPGWWHDMDIIIDEAEKRNMKVWILDDKHFPTGYANGLIETKYPERKKTYINFSTADIFGAPHKLTLNVKRMLQPTIKFWEIGKPYNKEERDKNEFVSMTALPFRHGNVFTEGAVDLSDTFDGENASFELPEGSWKIVVVYKTRTDGGDEAYINLIDEVSAHTQIEGVYEVHYEKYGDKFGKVIAGFFSDEPQFGNVPGFSKDSKIGKQMPLPWSDELDALLREKYGDTMKNALPYLWNSSEEMQLCPQIRYDYMDCVSRLYEKNFSRAIGVWCEEHGVEYIGHVVEDDGTHSRLGMGAAHYFRAMAGQHMAGIDCIGGQVVYGAPTELRTDMTTIDGEFYHYILGKMGASCGHLDPIKKGRTMCELFGAYGWQFGVRDMKYLLDHLLAKGINYFVPHAFSMAEYPDMDCPPHFYAGGNNPEFPYFAKMMKYANQMCNLLSGGHHVATAAVLYDAEAEWAGDNMSMQKVGKELLTHQIDFDVVSTDMLLKEAQYYGTEVHNKKLRINKEAFDVLIVPYAQRITKELATFIENAGELPVIFVDALPEQIVNAKEKHVPQSVLNCKVVSLKELAEEMKKEGFVDVIPDEAFADLSVYHYVKDRNIFMLQNESATKCFEGKIVLPTNTKLCIMTGLIGEKAYLPGEVEGERTSVLIHLYPGESCVIMDNTDDVNMQCYKSIKAEIGSCKEAMSLDKDWTVSRTKMIDYPAFNETIQMETLVPISDIAPTFSGVIQYKKRILLEKQPETAIIYAEHVYEVMTITVNGEEAGVCIQPPYQMDISKQLRSGTNEIIIEVATTPDRDQMNYPAPQFVMNHVAKEPTGMFGEVKLYMK